MPYAVNVWNETFVPHHKTEKLLQLQLVYGCKYLTNRCQLRLIRMIPIFFSD